MVYLSPCFHQDFDSIINLAQVVAEACFKACSVFPALMISGAPGTGCLPLWWDIYQRGLREDLLRGEVFVLENGKKQTLGDWVSLSAGAVFFGLDYRLIRSWVWLIKLIQDSLVDQVDPRSTLFACLDVVIVLPVTVCCWVQHDWLILWRPGPIKWPSGWSSEFFNILENLFGQITATPCDPKRVKKQSWHSSHLLQ